MGTPAVTGTASGERLVVSYQKLVLVPRSAYDMWLVETDLPFRPSNTALGPGRRSQIGDEQKFREKFDVLLHCSRS